MQPAPLVVTLDLDAQASAFFEDRRRRYFPAERNYLSAHVTLFHALPGQRQDDVEVALASCADRPVLPVRVTGVRFLGRGVAYDLSAPDADRLRDRIAQRFSAELTRQDAQRLRPHVTVANKLTPERARAVFDEMQAGFAPFEARAVGLSLYRYQGGP